MGVSYFFGCATQDGFTTDAWDDINDKGVFTYILKGGPGTGKSTIMRKVVAALDDAEMYHCSSDPDSLDAVLSRDRGVMVVDGTFPHIVEPMYPGVRQRIIDLGAFWNEEKLREKSSEIIKLTDENKSLHARVKRYLKAASSLYSDVLSIGENALIRHKLDSYSNRLADKLFPKNKGGEGGISKKRISAITPKGVVAFEDSFTGYSLYYVEDDCLAVSDRLLKSLSVKAIGRGYDVIVSTHPVLYDSVYDYLLIPELKIAFVPRLCDSAKRINAMRFYDPSLLRDKRKRLHFSLSAGLKLLDEITHTLKKAKSTHDELEKCYREAMDFDAVNALTQNLIEEIVNK